MLNNITQGVQEVFSDPEKRKIALIAGGVTVAAIAFFRIPVWKGKGGKRVRYRRRTRRPRRKKY
jgi:hypothetical protein